MAFCMSIFPLTVPPLFVTGTNFCLHLFKSLCQFLISPFSIAFCINLYAESAKIPPISSLFAVLSIIESAIFFCLIPFSNKLSMLFFEDETEAAVLSFFLFSLCFCIMLLGLDGLGVSVFLLFGSGVFEGVGVDGLDSSNLVLLVFFLSAFITIFHAYD